MIIEIDQFRLVFHHTAFCGPSKKTVKSVASLRLQTRLGFLVKTVI